MEALNKDTTVIYAVVAVISLNHYRSTTQYIVEALCTSRAEADRIAQELRASDNGYEKVWITRNPVNTAGVMVFAEDAEDDEDLYHSPQG